MTCGDPITEEEHHELTMTAVYWKQQHDRLVEENAKLKEMVTRVPGVIERLSNDIRDISISATADLLSDNAPVVLVNDKELEQSDTRANLDYVGDDNTSKPDSKPAVGKGPTSVSANSSSKRQPVTVPKPSSSSN